MAEPMGNFTSDPGMGFDRRDAPRHYEQTFKKDPGDPVGVDTALSGRERMVNPVAGGPTPEEEARNRQEAEYAARNQREETFENIVRNSETPGEILMGVRQIMEMAKDANTTEAMDDAWGIRTLSKFLYQKRLAMKTDPHDLERRGWIKDYDENTGEATTIDRRAGGFALKMEESVGPDIVVERIKNLKTGEISEISRPSTEFKFRYGTPAERKNMEIGLEKIYLEIGNDTIIGASLAADRKYRDDQATLSAVKYSHSPHFTVQQTEYAVNRTDESELNLGTESLKKKQDETAMWWFLGMMACETRAGLEDFLDRPATKYLVMPSAPGASVAQMAIDDIARTKFLKQQFGDWETWTDTGRTAKTLAQEVKDGKRGPVSKWGNIPARGRGDNLDFDFAAEEYFMDHVIGGMPGTNKDSAWYGACLLRSWEVLSIDGKVSFRDTAPPGTPAKDLVRLNLGADIFLQGTDMGKLDIPEYTEKEYASGRLFGPMGIVGIMPQLGLSYLDHAQIRKGYDAKGNPITLPMRTDWLGDKEKIIIDRVTNQRVRIPAIPYTPLGKLNYRTLPRGDHEAMTQLHALAFREGWVYDMIVDVDPDPSNYLEKGLRTFRKRFSIIYNALNIFKGNMYGQSDPGRAAAIEAQNAVATLLDAREQTQAWHLKQNRNIETFNPSLALHNKQFIGLPHLTREIRRRLGLTKGEEFKPDSQGLDNAVEINRVHALGLHTKLEKPAKKKWTWF